MKKISLSMFVALAFFVAMAVAQSGTARGASQGTTASSPSMSHSMGQTDQNTTRMTHEKREKTIKGCVQSQGSHYVLETRHGKTVALAGEDVSAHVGHEVAVKGAWEHASSASAASSSASGASAEKTFKVASVEMISDTCKAGKGSSGNMGTTSNGTHPSGTGSTTMPPK